MTTPATPDVEEPVDEAADTRRLHSAGLFEYLLLTDTDRTALRMERAHDLEAEVYRIQLAVEEAASDAEREQLAGRADQLLRRLRVHLTALSTAIPGQTPAGTRGNEGRRSCSRDPS